VSQGTIGEDSEGERDVKKWHNQILDCLSSAYPRPQFQDESFPDWRDLDDYYNIFIRVINDVKIFSFLCLHSLT
jgi:hypothetical protein